MATALTACLVLLILSLTVNVNSQTCSGKPQYGQCSSNNECGCLHLSFTDDVGICALIGVSCSRLSPCQSPNDACSQTDHICVRHPQCNSQPLCYPLSMIDQKLCPPVMTTSSPTTPSTISTTGFPWTSMTTSYSSNIISNYSSVLTVNSERYSRNGNSFSSTFTNANFTDGNFTGNHYYEAIQIVVNETGHYTFTSSSNMDAYGYLYQPKFDPFDPSRNLIAQDDDSIGNRQFTFSSFLQAGVPYTLVFTTFGERETGPFSVVATGPNTVEFTPLNSVQNTTTTTSTSATGFPWTSMTTSYSSNIISNYSSVLTVNSERYSRNGNSFSSTFTNANFTDGNFTGNHYYEAIQIVVNETGHYTFTSSSNMDAYGYLYQPKFDPFDPSRNLIAQDDDSIGNRQFTFSSFLQAGVPYTLVFTTFGERETGPFSVVATGPNTVDFTPSNIRQTTTTTRALPTLYHSSYPSELTMNSSSYSRNGNSLSSFYYEAIEVIINTTGSYKFTSKSNIDTYGYIYEGSFSPSYPTLNVRALDDDSGGNSQFQLTVSIQTGTKHILVVTTYAKDINGPFSVEVSGPDYLEFISINNL